MVVLCRPAGIFHKLVEERIGAFERDRALHGRVDGDRGEVLLLPGRVPFDERVLEPEDRKPGLIFVHALAAGIFDLLQRGLALFFHALEVLLREFAALVEHLAEAELQFLPRLRIEAEFYIPCDILPEVEHLFPRRRRDDLDDFEPLMLFQKHVIGSGRKDGAGSDFGFSRIRRRLPRVINFAVLIVGKADGSVVRPRPAPVRNDRRHLPAPVKEFELHKELGLDAVLVQKPPCAAAAAVPAVRQLAGENVFSVIEKRRHVRRLILDAFFIVGMPGRKAKTPRLLPVELHLIDAASGRIQPRSDDIFRRKPAQEAIDGIAFGSIHGIIPRDPLGGKVGRRQEPHFEGGFF